MIDSLTHTLFGFTLYGTVNKEQVTKKEKAAFFLTSVGSSLIPDIDVISKWWDTEGMYQMWHRGITHSLFVTPLWALFFYLSSRYLLRVNDRRIFFLALIGVWIHCTSDLFNAWGTGYFEPFSQIRISIGTIPIIDFVVWVIIFLTWFSVRLFKTKRLPKHYYYRIGFAFIAFHFIVQTIQGYIVLQPYYAENDHVSLTASFVPWNFQVITKNKERVQIYSDNLFKEKELLATIESKEDANLDELFAKNPKAKTLYEWSPFVVVVDDENRLGIYDPRFYRNGKSFLFEYIEKK